MRRSQQADGLGSFADLAPTMLHERLPCRIRQLSATEQRESGGDRVLSTHRMYCNVVDFDAGDRVVDDRGERYNIVSIDDPHRLGRFLEVELEHKEGVDG